MGVRIVTDSACDLPEDVAAALHIEVVPLTIRFGKEEFVDSENKIMKKIARAVLIDK